ncbi:MAG: aldehyde dehydrogenase family protein [Hyphomicrobiaceae bacterium]|nr:aldehyde dehydrogenase family protein [Hyphomicrobiaceae bacterium]
MSRKHATEFFIDGSWVAPTSQRTIPVIDPATEAPLGEVALGSAADVDKAVAAARAAFEGFSQTSVEDRMALLGRIADVYKKRFGEMGQTISAEMGAPISFATRFQAGAGMGHFRVARDLLKDFHFVERDGSTEVVREPIGVIGMITPWNWPANQICCKVAAALAAGCTMVLKPSEIAPYSALLIAEMLEEAGVPKGVFNLVNGDAAVGQAISAHPGIDCISFTGSTRAGIDVAMRAAPTVKRVGQELGGKSANIILDDAGFEKAVTEGVKLCFRNSGQSCNAPTRMLVPASRMAEAAAIARGVAETMKVGAPSDTATEMGPVVSELQWGKIQALIEAGIKEGAEVVTGGTGRPSGLDKGYYVKPTVFAGVTPAMTIAREEIFGPVLAIMPYKSVDDAVRIANDHPFGLAAYVSGEDKAAATKIARRLRAGMVTVNLAPADPKAPFGGYRQSGNGREWGRFGIEEYLETKAVLGAAA